MGNKSSKTSGTEVLPGVVLTPEAQAILNRQLNRKIVWSYKGTRFMLLTLALLPLSISGLVIFSAWNVAMASVQGFVVVSIGTILPALAARVLFAWARKY